MNGPGYMRDWRAKRKQEAIAATRKVDGPVVRLTRQCRMAESGVELPAGAVGKVVVRNGDNYMIAFTPGNLAVVPVGSDLIEVVG